jgi:hypothetical protein
VSAFRLRIELGNDAMRTGEDVARALREVADQVEGFDPFVPYGARIRDANGNTVGEWDVGEAEDAARRVERLHGSLDRASDLAIELAALSDRVRGSSREVAAALVDLIDRAEVQAEDPVLGRCPHGVDLDRDFCAEGCRV